MKLPVPFHSFKNIAAFEKYLQEQHSDCEAAGTGKYSKGECLDYVRVDGVLYTMHEYDWHGHQITWANKKHDQMIEVNTTNRYLRGYGDATVYGPYTPGYLRNDISYAQ